MPRLKIFLVFSFLCMLHPAANAADAPRTLPVLKMFKEVAALPDGRWLVVDKRAVRLLDQQGAEQGSLAVRAQHLDTRVLPDGVLAAVFDADKQQPLLLRVDAKRLRLDKQLAPVDFALDSMCLYRDAQQLNHLFLIAKDGQAEQWLLAGNAPKRLRRLALPPGVESCRADDARQALYVSEAGFGVWRYAANGEGIPERALLLGRRPHGDIAGEPGALAVLPHGIAVIDSNGGEVHLLDHDGNFLPQQLWLKSAEALAFAGSDLLVLDGKGWQAHALTGGTQVQEKAQPLPVVVARGQTETVARSGDAADDPAIWVHPQHPAQSRIIATNKKQGLLSYDLKGRQLQLLEAGRLNNVDVRQNIAWPGGKADLAVATQRDEAALAVFEIGRDGRIRDAGRVATGLNDIYGTCLYQPPGGGLEVFANDKDGRIEHYRIERVKGGYQGKLLRAFSVDSQPEGCVVDDHVGRLFVGEEKHGIWAMPASAGATEAPQLVMPVGEQLVADVEGLALYHGQGASYLVASSQGNSSYVVLDAQPPYAYRGAFRIGINADAGIDGVSDTDGLEVSAVDFGGAFRKGLLVVQDGYKRLPDGAQNFKYVAWEDIARALNLP